MRLGIMAMACIAVAGCSVQRIGPPGIVMTRPVSVPARNVLVYQAATDITAQYSVVDDVWIKDDGNLSPREMESHLRVQAGARGANAIILHRYNRRDNGTRILPKPMLNNPFDYYRATAVWIGEDERPIRYLGTLGGTSRQP